MKKFLAVLSVVAMLFAGTPGDFANTGAAASGEFDFCFYGVPVIANQYNTLPRDYVPKLVNVLNTGFRLEKKTLEAYLRMSAAAWDAGHKTLRLQSAYRSYETQRILHNNRKAQLTAEYGDRAGDIAAMVVARPGQSEHQLGNTIDVSINGRLQQSFGDTATGIWLEKNAHKFGFILRYPKDKTDITGVVYEPWHFRYVGEGIAKYIYENDLTLEEYVQRAILYT